MNVAVAFNPVMLDVQRPDPWNVSPENHKLTVQMEKDEQRRQQSLDETPGYAEAVSRLLFYVFINMVRYVFELKL